MIDIYAKFMCLFFSWSNYITASCRQCQDGTVGLVGGNSSYEGRVEVCEGGCWGSVCIGDNGWSSLDAAVVCNQLKMDSQGKNC